MSHAENPPGTALSRPRRPVPPARRTALIVRERVASPHWWWLSGLIFFCAVYFHSKVDPGIRFSFKNVANFNYGPAWWDTQSVAGHFSPADIATVMFAYLGLMKRLGSRSAGRFSRKGVSWTIAVTIPVLLGSLAGILHRTKSPFGDWRYLLMGALFAFGLWSTVLVSEEGCFRFAQLLVSVVSVYGIVQLAEYAKGGGEIAYYGRTPTGDHATLEFMVAATGISLALMRTGRSKWLWYCGILFPSIVVVLGFRRYAWVELAIVFGTFLVLSGRARNKYIAGVLALALAGVVAIALTWTQLNWSARFASLNPSATKQTNALAATNQSHINDILDGLDQVQVHPIMGLGVGITYVGQRTALWKGQAGMVHNGPVEIWIKFGLLGVLTFFAAYFALFRDIWRRRHGSRYSDMIAWGGGAFLLGNFFVTCTVYGWPYAVWEKSVLLFTVIAMMYPSGRVFRKLRRDGTEETPIELPAAPSPAAARA